jgi:pimeloyl-ACP methyl ester carboxylesterase
MTESKIAEATVDPEPKQPRTPADGRPAWKSILTSMLILAAVYAGRGRFLAWLIGGSYPWASMIVDCAVLALAILAFRLLDLGVKKLALRWIGNQTRTQRACAGVVNFAIIIGLGAPFFIALVQFHPQKIACGTTPAEFGWPYSDVQLESDGLRLAAWHLPASSPVRPVVVICHGLGANKQNFLHAAYVVHSLDFNVLIFDFRGHGDSDGRTFTFGIKESQDVKAAYDLVRNRHPSSQIYGLGYSVGGSALLRMASEHGGFDKIVIDSSFANAESVALHSILWYLGPLKRPTWNVGRFWGWVFAGVDVGQHNPEEYIARVRCPILLIHGTHDEMIPLSEAQQLEKAAGGNAALWAVDNVGHVETIEHPAYRERLQKFFEPEADKGTKSPVRRD